MNVKSFTFDENRRAIIEKEEGSEHHIDADTVIFATGQRPDLTEEAGLALGRANSIVVKENSLATETEGVFAAGDVVYGTKSVILAIASAGMRRLKLINILVATETSARHLLRSSMQIRRLAK